MIRLSELPSSPPMPLTIWVKVSTALLPQLTSKWSAPLHVIVEAEDDGTYTMTFKTPEKNL